MQDDATTLPETPEGYTLPPPINLGVMGVLQRPPRPTQATIDRVRDEVFSNRNLTPRERGRLLDEARIPSWKSETGHRVYFAQAPEGGRIKIGCSKSPRARLSDVRGESGIDVRLLGTIPGGFDVEKDLHIHFSEERIATKRYDLGDWFMPSERLLKFIQENAEFRRADEYIYLRNKRNRRVGR